MDTNVLQTIGSIASAIFSGAVFLVALAALSISSKEYQKSRAPIFVRDPDGSITNISENPAFNIKYKVLFVDVLGSFTDNNENWDENYWKRHSVKRTSESFTLEPGENHMGVGMQTCLLLRYESSTGKTFSTLLHEPSMKDGFVGQNPQELKRSDMNRLIRQFHSKLPKKTKWRLYNFLKNKPLNKIRTVTLFKVLTIKISHF